MTNAREVETKTKELIQQHNAGTLETQSSASGLKYVIHEEGTGKQAQAGMRVSVHYCGMLLSNGNKFDSSFDRRDPIDFRLGVGQVISGWDEGIALLKEGSKATLILPYHLAYGERGAGRDIPPRADLVFYVELVAAK